MKNIYYRMSGAEHGEILSRIFSPTSDDGTEDTEESHLDVAKV